MTEVFELVPLRSGTMSLRSLRNLETFHPVTGPEVEARILHVEQQALAERARKASEFVIWDVGLGAAANALSVLAGLKDVKTRIALHSFDQTLSPLRFAMKNASELKYLLGYEVTLSELIQKRRVEVAPGLTWYFHEGDFSGRLETSEIPSPHSILYDPYSLNSNPEMWTLQHFERLFRKLDPGRPCLWTNYTRSTSIRAALLLAGFFVGVGRSVGEKAETTIASNHLEMLEQPLDRKWLKRLRASRNSAPFREGMTLENHVIDDADFSRIESHPQFREALS